jgi:Right handed beta helix region
MNIEFLVRRLTAALFAMLLIGGLCGRASADTAVSSCQTLSAPGNYFLTANLSSVGDCLVIGADNVAIDLKGKTITGNGTGSGITDGGIDRDVAIIANGKIRNFNRGIYLSASGSAIISNVNSSGNTADGIFIDRCCNTLNSDTANNNGGNGIDITSDDSSLSNIVANGNGGDGVFVTQCCNTLVGSTASNNSGNGVEMGNCCNFVISSKIQNNSGDGISLEEDDGVIKSNTSNNAGDGMDFSSTVNLVTSSKSNGNGGAGIDMGSHKWGIFSGVTANKNSSDGVDMGCRGSTASLTATKNSGTNLVQTVLDGPCANVDLNAP